MNYITSHTGEFAALAVAIFWTVTALAFESASRKVGSLTVNILRLIMAFFFLGIYTLITNGHFLSLDASIHNWLWLGLSGIVGLVLGDYFLFRSYPLIGSRFAMLIMTLAPPLAAIFGYFILGESLNLMQMTGMIIVIFGISLAIFNKPVSGERLSIKISPAGLLFAFIGAIGQGLGIVLSKYGMEEYDAFASTQIRIIAGIAGFSILITLLRRWGNVAAALKNPPAMKALTVGAIFGPFLGISFSLLAVRHTQAGIASTIMAIVPVLILAPSAWIYKEKITAVEIAGAIISVAGVAFFFI
ncbi:MAG TPA: DMT family transporter [Bacteroidales bacterium]|jgi:drug/metabolite transporter (DMT)-like permease|nr:DMT family transporter [Bacteroidales bacterium]HQJ13535.1 DMT family transporter [Bacteroidales bacterium]